jgi:dephospho-CoA kinase
VGRVVAVSGLSGAGKSTAIRYLARRTSGELFYLGATVLRVVRDRGLPETSASEQTVRAELRDQHGRACLVILEADRIKGVLSEGRYVLVDAVYCVEEFDYLSQLANGIFLIGIETSFETRLARLGARRVRPMTKAQLKERDSMDVTSLKNSDVLAKASVRISNEGSIAELNRALRGALEGTSLGSFGKGTAK